MVATTSATVTGDPWSLVVEHEDVIVRISRREARTWNLDFDDVEQEVRLCFFRAARSWDPGRGAFLPFALSWSRGVGLRMAGAAAPASVTVHGMLHRDDASPHLSPVELPDEVADSEEPTEPDVDLARAVAALAAGVEGLPPRERELITQRYGLGGDELTQDELADRMGVARRTLRGLESQALDRLRAAIGRDPLRAPPGSGYLSGRARARVQNVDPKRREGR